MFLVNNKKYINFRNAKEYATKNKFAFVFDTEKSENIDVRQKVFILYQYFNNNNDIQYIREFTNKKSILNFLNISKSCLNDSIIETQRSMQPKTSLHLFMIQKKTKMLTFAKKFLLYINILKTIMIYNI